jgi:hypothetical protein
MERYTVVYPRGQPGLPNDPVTAYVNDLRATYASPGSATIGELGKNLTPLKLQRC